MADIRWIKLDVNIFDNRKIKMLQSMPNGDALIVLWLKVLCLAGNVNDGGDIYLTAEIPYTDQMLATQFNQPLTTVQLALNVFEQFGMIEIIDNIIHVSNWEKYQNVDGMERIREQTRKRVADYREKRKEIAECNVTVTLPVTQCNATDKEEEKNKNKSKSKEDIKHKYGYFQNILLTDSEYSKLHEDFEHAEDAIEYLSSYIAEKGYKSKNHNLTIRRWVIDAVTKGKQPSTSKRVIPSLVYETPSAAELGALIDKI